MGPFPGPNGQFGQDQIDPGSFSFCRCGEILILGEESDWADDEEVLAPILPPSNLASAWNTGRDLADPTRGAMRVDLGLSSISAQLGQRKGIRMTAQRAARFCIRTILDE